MQFNGIIEAEYFREVMSDRTSVLMFPADKAFSDDAQKAADNIDSPKYLYGISFKENLSKSKVNHFMDLLDKVGFVRVTIGDIHLNPQ